MIVSHKFYHLICACLSLIVDVSVPFDVNQDL